MSFEDFKFVNRTRCAHCGTSLLIVDKKIISCPLCELKKKDQLSGLENKRAIFQELY